MISFKNVFKLVRKITYPKVFFQNNYNITLQISRRSFQCNTKLSYKMFMEHENKYAYDIMETKGYAIPLNVDIALKNMISKEQYDNIIHEDWSRKSPQELFEILSVLGLYCNTNGSSIIDRKFDGFVDSLTDNIKFASNEELKSIFYSLVKWPEVPSIRSRNYIEIWAALDDECLKRYKEWSIDQTLSFLSLFYLLNVTRASDFSLKALNMLATKAKRLSPGQFVQTLFFVGVMRKSPHDMHNLEVYLEDNLDCLTLDELGIVSMGFFKSKIPIRNTELVNKIIGKVKAESTKIHEISLAALLKIIRYSMKFTHDVTVYELLDVLQYEVPRLSVMCCVHVALCGTSTLTLHQACLDAIAEYTSQNIAKARMKDLERLVLVCGMFNYKPKISSGLFFDFVIGELRNPHRDEEICKYGRSFACCVSYLTLLENYPVDLIDKIFEPEFLLNSYGKVPILYGREILHLHNTAEIFGLNVKNKLSSKAVFILAKRYTDYFPEENYKKQYNVSEKMILDIVSIIKEGFGERYFLGHHILTHHQRGDIILCFDKNHSPLPVDAFPREFGKIHYPPDDNNWVVLVPAGRNIEIKNSDKVSGPYLSKIRELNKIGYKAALVPYSIWYSFKDKEEKYQYLIKVIDKVLKY